MNRVNRLDKRIKRISKRIKKVTNNQKKQKLINLRNDLTLVRDKINENLSMTNNYQFVYYYINLPKRQKKRTLMNKNNN